MADATTRPVQLQANVAGAWRTVLQFDAGDCAAAAKAQEGAQLLHEAGPATSWRITTTERPPLVLRHLSRSTYGIWIDRSHH